MKSDLTIGCISDEKYVPLLKPFLTSLYNFNQDIKVYATLVDCEHLNDNVQSISNNITIVNDNISLSTKRKHLARHGLPVFDTLNNTSTKPISGGFKGPRWLMSDKACYCSNIRFRVIADILNRGHKQVLFMDVDAIVRKPLHDLTKLITDHDITILKEIRGFNSENPALRDKFAPPDFIDWHCGIIGIRNNEICREFISKVQERTEADMWNWDADQDQFNITFNEYADKVKLCNLPKEFKDEGYRSTGYSDNSYIWCGAGEAKYSNSQYITEQNKWI